MSAATFNYDATYGQPSMNSNFYGHFQPVPLFNTAEHTMMLGSMGASSSAASNPFTTSLTSGYRQDLSALYSPGIHGVSSSSSPSSIDSVLPGQLTRASSTTTPYMSGEHSYASSPRSMPTSTSASPMMVDPLGALTLSTSTSTSAPTSQLSSGTSSPLFGYTVPQQAMVNEMAMPIAGVLSPPIDTSSSMQPHQSTGLFMSNTSSNAVTTHEDAMQMQSSFPQYITVTSSVRSASVVPVGTSENVNLNLPPATPSTQIAAFEQQLPVYPDVEQQSPSIGSPKRVGVRRRSRSSSSDTSGVESSSDSGHASPSTSASAPAAPQKRKYRKAPKPVEPIIHVDSNIQGRATRSRTRGSATASRDHTPVDTPQSAPWALQLPQPQHGQYPQQGELHSVQMQGDSQSYAMATHGFPTQQHIDAQQPHTHDAVTQITQEQQQQHLPAELFHMTMAQTHTGYPTHQAGALAALPSQYQQQQQYQQQTKSSKTRTSTRSIQLHDGGDDDDEDDEDGETTMTQEMIKKQRLAHKASLARAARAKRKTLISSLQNDVHVLRVQLDATQDSYSRFEQFVQLHNPELAAAWKQSSSAAAAPMAIPPSYQDDDVTDIHGSTASNQSADGPLILVDTSQLAPQPSVTARITDAINLLLPTITSIRHQELASDVYSTMHPQAMAAPQMGGHMMSSTGESPSRRSSKMARLHFRDINQESLDRSNMLTSVIMNLQSIVESINKPN